MGLILLTAGIKGDLKIRGLITGFFFFGYGVTRFAIEIFRQPDTQFVSKGNSLGYAFKYSDYGLTLGQALSIPMIVIGMILLIYAIVRDWHGSNFYKGQVK